MKRGHLLSCQRQLILAKRRLLFATSGALLFHLLLMILGDWGIGQITIPSNEERTLVFTLQTTPLEGLQKTKLRPDDTINEVRLGELKSIGVNSKRSQAHSGLDVNPNPQAIIEPLPTEEIAQDSPPITPPIQPITAPVEVSDLPATAVMAAANSGTDEQVLEMDQPLMTTKMGHLKMPGHQRRAQLERVLKVPLTAEQRNMLDRRITKSIEKMQQFDAATEMLSWQEKGQVYKARLRSQPASGDMDLDEILVEVMTEKDGNRLTTEMRMKKLAFSSFAQFVHRWDSDIRFHNDEMYGRFHSNSAIHLDFDRNANSVFYGKVTTSSGRVNVERKSAGYSRHKVFRGGLETGVKRINMPGVRQLFIVPQGEAEKNEFLFARDTRIIFHPSGHFLLQDISDVGPPQIYPIGDKPLYLTAAKGVSLHISGTLKGSVLVYSPQRIVIEGDLLYNNRQNQRPVHSVEKGNILGLVSGKDIEIAGPKVTGPGDLVINASIYARRRLIVLDHHAKNTGTLHVNGSLTVGVLTATEPRYATKIVFDQRLESLRPPGFPVTDRYELAMYDRDWKSEAIE